MFFSKTRSLLVLLVATLVTAALAATASPALAAKPSMGPATLHSTTEFWAAQARVDGASLVAICVSRKCALARKLSCCGGNKWVLDANVLPTLHKGQRREVIVFALGASREFNYSVQTVTVRSGVQ